MAQKLYNNPGAKRMVIILGKQKNLTTPLLLWAKM
jgi:hypothetical protein